MEKKDTKICKHCKEEIDKKAKRCPKCGGKLGFPTWAKVLIIIAIVLICIVACVNSCTDAVDKSVKETFGGYDDQSGKTSFKVGETFKSKHIKIRFDSSNLDFKNYSEYAEVKAGYKVVEFKFTAENISKEDQTFDYTDFNCYADDNAMQQFYLTEDAGLDSFSTISHGKKATVPIYCEVPKNSSKVTVEYKPVLADKHYKFNA